ncbi:phage tail tape measure protein [Streptomyces sp. NPDC057638]|uniref:phage tail tape measure protein n=1 Tax=Streptomyces sp. NPDC057638 TaxID=3346190 RepID=UPI0036872E77
MAGRPSTLAIRVTSDSRQARQDIRGAEGEVTGTLGKLKTAGPALAAAAGAAIGMAIAAAFGKALEQGKITARLGAQLGTTPAEGARLGKITGQLFAKGVGDDFQQVADSISAVMRSGLAPPGATNAQLESIATKATDLGTTFTQDVGQASRTAAQMIKTGLVRDADEAFDVLTRGFQSGANAADDLLATFSEYSTQFRDLGLSGQTAMGLLSQGLKGGARDADVVADALKELNIRVKDKSAATALKELGLNADEMALKFTQGGPQAATALDSVLDRLRAVKDPAERSRLAVALLGTQAEDLAGALYSLDPSTAVSALGSVKGASDRLGTSLRDNAAAKIESFQRTAQQKLVNFLGQHVLPALVTMWRWWEQKIAPVISKVTTLYGTYMAPVLAAVRSGVDKVSGAVRDNEHRWRPLWDLLQKHVVPIAGKVAGVLAGAVFDGVVGVINVVSRLVGWFSTLVGWIRSVIEWFARLKPPSWLRTIGDWLPFAAPEQRAAARAALGPTTRTARTAPPRWIAQLTTAPTVVNVTIDGQQLQGRITRTVTSAMQYEGARYLAGGWA